MGNCFNSQKITHELIFNVIHAGDYPNPPELGESLYSEGDIIGIKYTHRTTKKVNTQNFFSSELRTAYCNENYKIKQEIERVKALPLRTKNRRRVLNILEQLLSTNIKMYPKNRRE